MQVTFDIDDRKALPLRAIPYVTSWKTPPDEIVNVLAAPKTKKVGQNLEIQNRHNELFAYQMNSQRSLVRLPPSQWEAWIITYRSLTAQLIADERSGATNENYANWRIKAVLELPDNVFVWLDEFQAWYSSTRPLTDSAPEHDGDWETESDSLCLVPLFPPALESRLWRYAEGFIATKPVGLEESVVIHRYPIAPEEPVVIHHGTLQATAEEVPVAAQTEPQVPPRARKPKEVRMNENRAFLQTCFKQGIDKNIGSVWIHIHMNAGKPNFMFRAISKGSATTIDGKQVLKKNLARALSALLKTQITD